jgi:hypothetical protein
MRLRPWLVAWRFSKLPSARSTREVSHGARPGGVGPFSKAVDVFARTIQCEAPFRLVLFTKHRGAPSVPVI